MQNELQLNFIISFCKDIIPDKGEDSFCYSFCDTAGILAVFDGCGGAGAREHSYYSGKTEAYIASRLCAGSFYDDFRAIFPCDLDAKRITEEIFAPNAIQRLKFASPPQEEGEFVIKGTMVRTLPTTVAGALVRADKKDAVSISALWAGDSRVFVLTSDGLSQLSIDDTSVPDPMDNLYEDGVLKNIFCSDRKVQLHCKTIQLKPPFVVLAATDGCFGYVSTPMEFEGILIKALLESDSPKEWESNLAERLGEIASDDHTLCLAAFGYKSFSELKKSMSDRYLHINEEYLIPISGLSINDRQSRSVLWREYSKNYMKYIEEGLE